MAKQLTNADIRKEKRQARRSITAHERARYDQHIIEQIQTLSHYQNAEHIAIFKAFDGEVNLDAFAKNAWSEGKSLYLPVILGLGNPLQFVPYKATDQLIEAEYGILRPDRDAHTWVEGAALDLVLTPLVAFNANLQRLGMGAGYYDRTFAFKHQQSANDNPIKPDLIGVAYTCQQDERIMVNEWDVSLDAIVTESVIS